MEIRGDILLHTPRSLVWAALNDPKVLAKCTPGCQLLEPQGEFEYRVILELGVAAIKGKYEGRVTISDQVPETSYRITITGDGLTGFMRGDGVLSLALEGEDTRLSYEVQAQVGGKVAGIGQRIMTGVAKMLIGRFFSNLEQELATNSERTGGDAAR